MRQALVKPWPNEYTVSYSTVLQEEKIRVLSEKHRETRKATQRSEAEVRLRDVQ